MHNNTYHYDLNLQQLNINLIVQQDLFWQFNAPRTKNQTTVLSAD